jgi:hypothetical protein
MKTVSLINDAPVLIPNQAHSNFTKSDEILKKGSIIQGDEIFINGKRRGEDFTYRLFKTKDGKLIYTINIQPMNTTEVKLGVAGSRESAPSKTVVDMATSNLFTTTTIVGTAIGVVAGMMYTKNKNFEASKKYLYIGAFALAGYSVARYYQRKKIVISQK